MSSSKENSDYSKDPTSSSDFSLVDEPYDRTKALEAVVKESRKKLKDKRKALKELKDKNKKLDRQYTNLIVEKHGQKKGSSSESSDSSSPENEMENRNCSSLENEMKNNDEKEKELFKDIEDYATRHSTTRAFLFLFNKYQKENPEADESKAEIWVEDNIKLYMKVLEWYPEIKIQRADEIVESAKENYRQRRCRCLTFKGINSLDNTLDQVLADQDKIYSIAYLASRESPSRSPASMMR